VTLEESDMFDFDIKELKNLSDHLLTGIVFMLFLAMLILFTYPAFNNELINNFLAELIRSKEPNINIYDNKFESFLLFIFFIIGWFIPEIENKGFTYYSRLYEMKKTGIKHMDDNGIKLPGLAQRALFYIFRNGTFIEECYDTNKAKYEKIKCILNKQDITKKQRKYYNKILKKENRIFYDWIQETENPIKNLTKYTQETYNQNLARSQLFHTLDITFLFIMAICFLTVIVNIFLKYYFSFNLSCISPFVIGVIALFFHFLSRSIAVSWAAWYFRYIDFEISGTKKGQEQGTAGMAEKQHGG
jgi:ABC-type multidrug transport system fused ATPase/permease subunit